MADKNAPSAEISEHALEMIMRDVMDGIMDWSIGSALSGPCCEFEIIEIEPARQRMRSVPAPLTQNAKASDAPLGEIVDFPVKRRAWG